MTPDREDPAVLVVPAAAPASAAPLVGRDATGPAPIVCSVGIMAYNEEANIANAISSILSQRTRAACVAEVIVVASGCKDATGGIVAKLARQEPRLRLIEQRRREGKASAINLFINSARSDVLLMASADVLLQDGAVDALLRHFRDPAVGMVGGRPAPVNGAESFLGHVVHLQWRMHDRVACQHPKLGEVVAFRNVVPSIPLETAVDEISLEALITQLGYRLVYDREAVVYNRGPGTLRDFLRQRRRIYAGHVLVQRQQGYRAATMDVSLLVRSLQGSGSFTTPRAALWTVGAMGLEASARALGHLDVLKGRSQYVWDVSGTTKRGIVEGARARVQPTVAVFRVADVPRHELERGLEDGRRLTRRVAAEIQRALSSEARLSVHAGGIIVAFVPDARQAVERIVEGLLHRFATEPLAASGRSTPARVRVDCSVISFPSADQLLASKVAREVVVPTPIVPSEVLSR